MMKAFICTLAMVFLTFCVLWFGCSQRSGGGVGAPMAFQRIEPSLRAPQGSARRHVHFSMARWLSWIAGGRRL